MIFHSKYVKCNDAQLRWDRYRNKRPCLSFVDGNGSALITCSVNMPAHELEGDEICIKDYSENEGTVQALINLGIISRPIRYIGSGFVDIPVCRLLVVPS